MDAKALASPHLAVILAGNKVDVTEDTAGEAEPTPSSVSSRQSAFGIDASGSIRSVIPGSRWTATHSKEGREVAPDVASRWASKASIPAVLEVSALSGENVEEMFTKLARMIPTKIELGEIDPDDPQSGIQYGDIGNWGSGSAASGLTMDDNTIRRRRRGGNVLTNGLADLGDVFQKPGGRKCC